MNTLDDREKNWQQFEKQFVLLDSMYKNLPVGVIVYDKNGLLVSLNKKNREIMGIPDDIDLIGLNLFKEINLPEEQQQQLLQGKNVAFNLDYDFDSLNNYFLTNNKGIKPLYIKISPIIKEGNVDGYLLINQDMSELMMRDNLLEQTSIKLATMFDTLSTGIEIYDKNGLLTDCNAHEMVIFGIDNKEQFLNSGVSVFENPNLSDECKNALKKGQNFQFELLYDFDKIRKTNYYKTSRTGKISVETKAAPMFNKQKKLLGYVFETNEKTKEKELYENNVLVLNNIKEGLIYMNSEAKLIWSNLEAFGEQDGLGAFKHLILDNGRCCYWENGICHSPNSSDHICLLNEASRTNTIQTKVMARGDNKYKFTVIPVFDAVKDVTNFLYKIEDITKWEKINSELVRAKEEAERSDKLKSSFLANMSHEIRTPLNAIVGFSELLAEEPELIHKEEYAKIIQSNNNQLLRLIGDILDLSKIESGLIELKYEKFDMVSVFHNVYESFKQKMTDSKVKLLCDSPYAKCIVNLDKNRMVQVLSNFLGNAIKYTPSGHIKMGYSYEDKGIRLYVEDTGIGIAKDKYDKVFVRFEKLDTFAKGTGLGLSICKAIADVKHGHIGFTSEEGKGSTFWVWFPTTVEIKPKEEAE